MATANIISMVGITIAGIALILSFISQIITWYDRRLNHMPHIRIWLGTEEGGFVSFGVSNDGLGAAKVEEFTLTVDGEKVEFNMLFTALFGVGKNFVSKKLAPPPAEIGIQSSVEIFRISCEGLSDHQLMHEFATRVGVKIKARAISLKDKRTEINLERITRV